MAQTQCTYRRTLTEAESGYLAGSELEAFLERQFGPGLNFEIQSVNYRWKFKTPQPLDDALVRDWIVEMQNRKRPVDKDYW